MRSKNTATAVVGYACFLTTSWLCGGAEASGAEAVEAKATEVGPTGVVSFEEHVRPILKAHCLECHGEGKEIEGGLDLRLRRSIHSGGDSGPGFVEGAPDESPLLERALSEDMPPGDTKLTAVEVETIRGWIEAGATTLRDEPESIPDGVYVPEEERNFWSFTPIHSPEIPQVQHTDRVRTPVDAFLLRRLEENGLEFSADADRRTFIRRATFDLTGLPPLPEEVRRFVEDTDSDAVEKLIDRLLESPEYGERWGRHWLDVAGYADSEGYTIDDVVRQHAYHYRDYVINSFNDNLPFDQFIREQIAGDEMIGFPKKNLTPDEARKLIATGFLRMVPDGTGSGGVEQPVARNQVVADAIQVVGSSLLGLTIQCAQCHNHRYDPIPQVEYFQIRAIFEPAYDWKNWRNPKARLVSLYNDEDRSAAAEVEAVAKKVDVEYGQLSEKLIAETLEDQLAQHVPAELQGALREAYQSPAKERTAAQNEHLKKYPKILKISRGSLYLYDREIRIQLAGLKKNHAAKCKQHVETAQTKVLANLESDVSKALLSAIQTTPAKRSETQQELLGRQGDIEVTLDNLVQFDDKAAAELAQLKTEIDNCKERAPQLEAVRTRANEIRAKKPKENFVRALTESPGKVPDTLFFSRGDYRNPEQQIMPAVLTVPAVGESSFAISANSDDLPTTGRRLAYANHLTSGRHPLVARVLVNRFWMHHFGKGIVPTPSDFGLLGQRPSHPDLLNWLAADFMHSGWDVKRFHRLVMTSTVYRQALRTVRPNDSDPDNVLLSGTSIRRLEAETLRDSMLRVSGNLNAKRFGPPVPVMPDRVGQIVIGVENQNAGRPGSEIDMKGEEFRRSVYVQVRRSRPLAMLDTFDGPRMSPNCETRPSSTVAPQSLMLMNSDFVLEQSNIFAARLINEAGDDRLPQIQLAWELAFGTAPTGDESDQAIAFIAGQAEYFGGSEEAKKLVKGDKQQTPDFLALASFCQMLISSNRFLYID